jgi:hypothetical protein
MAGNTSENYNVKGERMNRLKLYYDNFSDDIEIVCPDGTVYFGWYDCVVNSAGFIKAQKNYITSQNNHGDTKRFEYLGEF